MKRVIGIAGIIFLLGLPLFGGGQNEKTGGAAAQGPVTVTYISSTILERPEGVFEQQQIDAFNAAHKDSIIIKVEGVASNDQQSKYIALATAGQMPDFYIGAQTHLVTMADMGQTTDMRSVFDAEYLAGFVQPNLDAASINGILHGIPWFGNAQGVLYRKDLFDAKGIKIPTTWDEFVTAAKALTGGGSYGITLVGTKNSSGGGRFQAVTHNYGVDEFIKGRDGKWTTDLGSPQFAAALKAFTDLDLVHHVVPPGVIETGYPEAVALFSSGKAAMLITGSNAIGAITSQVPELKGKLGSFPLPGPARSVSTAGGYCYMINPKTSYKQEAAVFIKFMLEDETSLAFSELTGRLPTRKSVFSNPKIPQMPELVGFLKAVENVYVNPTLGGYGEINDIYGEAYQSVFTKMATVEQAAEKAKQRAQKICDAANSGSVR
jgi:ABC-type glycerol-3-phosphate transport system substrate-binding protein